MYSLFILEMDDTSINISIGANPYWSLQVYSRVTIANRQLNIFDLVVTKKPYLINTLRLALKKPYLCAYIDAND